MPSARSLSPTHSHVRLVPAHRWPVLQRRLLLWTSFVVLPVNEQHLLVMGRQRRRVYLAA